MVEALLDSYKPKLPPKILQDVRKFVTKKDLSKKDVERILVEVKKEYDSAKIHSGEAIGVITAESFGEPSTQMILNVFHFAGVAELAVSTGLPRIIELLDARKTIKTPRMEVYLQAPHNKDPKAVKRIAAKIKQIKLEELSTNFVINLSKLQVEVTLNKAKIKDLHISEESIIDAIKKSLKGIAVKEKEDGVLVLRHAGEEGNELLSLYKLKEKVKDVPVGGLKGISQVLPVKEGNEYIILTGGSNLKGVMALEEVDASRTTTNDIHEVRKVLGIEAARQAVVREVVKIYEDQGLDIDIRHVFMIADIITHTGEIKGITRSGITGEKVSVLARASFETPLKHIVNASLIGEEDTLNSVIENVLLNQPVPLGTGLPDLITKMAKGGEEQ